MTKGALSLIAALLLAALAIGLSGKLVEPPALRPAGAAGPFDARAAIAAWTAVLGPEIPHPVDSAANDAVRERLVAALRRAGLRPRVDDRFACTANRRAPTIACARVRNVVASVGPSGGRHVLLVSHYDSTPVGPGAADDGIGIAVALELAAQLARRPPPRPVSFLFTDGEEAGLIGARAFMDADPLRDRIGALINMEARGVEGRALMFETSDPNGAAVAAYGAGVDRPAANSLSADFYAMVPNSTDVDIFRPAGWTILNFAVIGNETRYHSPGDTLAALDPRSVQHMGDQVAGAVQALVEGRGGGGEKVYADLLGHSLVVLPLQVALITLGLLLIGATVTLWFRRSGALPAVATIMLALAAAAVIAWAAQAGLKTLRPGDFWRSHPDLMALAAAWTGLAAAGAAVLWRRAPPATLRAAFWWLFLLLGAGLSSVASGASIFFLAPPALALVGIVLGRRWPALERAGGWAAALLLFFTLAPLLALIGILLGYGAAWIFALIACLILLPAAIEISSLLRAPAKLAAACLALLLVGGWAATALAPAYSADRKQGFGIEHVTQAGRARWLVANDGAPLPAAYRGFSYGAKVPWSTRRRWSASAPLAPTILPKITRVSEERRGRGRVVRLQIASGGAMWWALRAPPGSGLVAASVNGAGRRFGRGRPGDEFLLRCRGRSCDGAQIELLIAGESAVDLQLSAYRPGLPAAAAPLVQARPREAAPQYTPDQQVVIEHLAL